MENKNKEKGFTFYTILFILTILIMCIPIEAAILKTMKNHSYYQEISIQQFFFFLQQEVIQASELFVHSDGRITLRAKEDLITIELYGDNIRRQVNGQGHEIYLRKIKEIQFAEEASGFIVTITDKKGYIYEKKINFYP
ncbi:ComGF family competence protein [Ornithinibacillus bavariensis]|uniref:Competence protein ComGF n=1 Tax=Ornithinibacillus bavariensis TaxID=545502 RepID=A0A919X7Q5_9BACI|nr:ComGF family competence protein [Ornithinibacillus bavariensis]GIO27512.1 hypothetical protein J43TS3_21230 [Ornithinibacillus bavariensis]